MKLSSKGLELIKGFESYLKKQPDGSCKSYQCPAGKWTCGWGCTEGVGPLTHWSSDEATEALAVEMRKHEQAVEKLVTVPLTQGQFDALVSFSYNVGSGALAKSAILKHLNAGDYARAASHFGDYKKARVQGATAKLYKVADGTLITLPGLVTRRAAETALFLEAAPQEMAQAVEPAESKMKIGEAMMKMAAPAVAGTAAVTQAAPLVPSVPPEMVEAVKNVGAWKSLAMSVAALPAELQAAGLAGAAGLATVVILKKVRG